MADPEVPSISIIDEHLVSHAPPLKMKRSDSCHIDFETLKKGVEVVKAEAITYFNQHGITETMDSLVSQILQDRPEHPVVFCASTLRTTEVVEGQSRLGASPIDPREMLRRKFEVTDAPREYIDKFNLPLMFEDLLNQLADQKPEDPHNFCLTWLRWHRQIFEDNMLPREGA